MAALPLVRAKQRRPAPILGEAGPPPRYSRTQALAGVPAGVTGREADAKRAARGAPARRHPRTPRQVYNGDIGHIADVDPEAGELTASFEGRETVYGFGKLDAVVPAYAATVHKSQGSEYAAVVIPVLTRHDAMLRRNLLYTGVTRGKRLVVLLGQKKAVAMAVRNVSGWRRWSKLDEWLGRGPTDSAAPPVS